MQDWEGPFRLVTLVGECLERPGRWFASSCIHAVGERRALEVLNLEGDFDSYDSARSAAMEAARDIAKRLDPLDCLARRAMSR